MSKLEELNLLLKELNFLEKSLNLDNVKREIRKAIVSIPKEKCAYFYYKFITLLKLSYKLKNNYKMHGN